jgi:ABC-type transporter Mla MlaB component
MMHVHRFEEPYSVRLRIEGVLAAEAVAGVEQSWEEAVSRAHGRKLMLDASGVARVDDAGIAFLRRLRAAGASVDDDGRFVPVSGAAASSLRRVRHAICARLCAAMPSWHRCPCGLRL